jgi:hypothetical protein
MHQKRQIKIMTKRSCLFVESLRYLLSIFVFLGFASTCLGQVEPPAFEICEDGPYVRYLSNSVTLERVIPRVITPVLTPVIVTEHWTVKPDQTFPIEIRVGAPIQEWFEVLIRRNHRIPESKWLKTERILVTSDLEGNFDAFARILRSQGVVDERLKWSFGNGHLVILGDTMDRGNYVAQCLWLIYKLEAEGEAAGGAVHMILGNHEAMNLKGDDRYLAPKYRWLLNETGSSIDSLYDDNSELGRWLRSKNAIERIGDLLFVHAGIGPELLEKGFSIDQINELGRSSLGEKKLAGDQKFIMGSDGPLWYRGLVIAHDDKPKASTEHVNRVLRHFEASRVLVGHTIVDEISTDYEGQVVRVDVKHPQDSSHGVVRALLIEGGKLFVVGDDNSRREIK